MISLGDIETTLRRNTRFQQTTIQMIDEDWKDFTIQGVKRLYVDEGIGNQFPSDFDEVSYTLQRNLTLTEQEYCWISAEIVFRTQIKDSVNAIIGYTTDALSITGANAPYSNLQNTINALENRLSQLRFEFVHKQV